VDKNSTKVFLFPGPTRRTRWIGARADSESLETPPFRELADSHPIRFLLTLLV